MSLAPTRDWPDVDEGYTGTGTYEVYAFQKWHGARQVRIAMPKGRFIAMQQQDRHRWMDDARRRVSRGMTR